MGTVCIVGCGGMGRVHAEHLSRAVRLAYCDRSREMAEWCLRRFGGSGVFDRFERALETADIDAVVIASPPEFHAAQAIQALEAGKAVLVEKPMCLTPGEVEAIAQVIGCHPDARLMVAENYYYKPVVLTIRQLVADNALGPVESVTVQKRRLQGSNGWKRGLGALIEGGIHFVALVSDIFPSAPQKVSAVFPGHQPGTPERNSVTTLVYPGGARAELRYSWNTPHPLFGAFQHSRISGPDGTLTFESNGLYAVLNSRSTGRRFIGYRTDVMGRGRMNRDFLDCLADPTKRPYSDFAKARRDLQIVFDAYRYL